jgi:hypothetical protein
MNSQPTELNNTPKPRKPLWRRILTWTIRIVVVLVVVVAVAWGVRYYISGRELQAEIAKFRAIRQPLTFAEWEKSFPTVAEADDAAPFYKAALVLRQSSTDEKVMDLLDRLTAAATQPATAPAPSDEEIEEVLTANAGALEKVDLGSARPQCAYDFDLSGDALEIMLPWEGKSWRALARLLRLRTDWLARQGRASEAVNSLVSSFRFLRIADRHPALIASLVKISGETLNVDAIPTVLEAGPLSDRELAAIESVLAQADPTVGMDRVWIAEQVCALEMWRETSGEGRELFTRDMSRLLPRLANLLRRPLLRSLITKMLRANNQCIEAARRSWPEAFDIVQELASRTRDEFGLMSYDKAFAIFGRTAGQVRSAQVAVMVERYRLAKGHLPESLEELRGFIGRDLPADPFTGKDLIYKIYKVQGEGFLVYSLGEDKADDGGPSSGFDKKVCGFVDKKDWGLAVRRVPK